MTLDHVAPRRGLSAYDRDSHAGFLRNLVVREGRRVDDVRVTAERRPEFARDLGDGTRLWDRIWTEIKSA